MINSTKTIFFLLVSFFLASTSQAMLPPDDTASGITFVAGTPAQGSRVTTEHLEHVRTAFNTFLNGRVAPTKRVHVIPAKCDRLPMHDLPKGECYLELNSVPSRTTIKWPQILYRYSQYENNTVGVVMNDYTIEGFEALLR